MLCARTQQIISPLLPRHAATPVKYCDAHDLKYHLVKDISLNLGLKGAAPQISEHYPKANGITVLVGGVIEPLGESVFVNHASLSRQPSRQEVSCA